MKFVNDLEPQSQPIKNTNEFENDDDLLLKKTFDDFYSTQNLGPTQATTSNEINETISTNIIESLSIVFHAQLLY